MDASIPVNPAAAELDRALVIRNLRKEYRAGQPVLKDVSLTVEARGMTAIIVSLRHRQVDPDPLHQSAD